MSIPHKNRDKVSVQDPQVASTSGNSSEARVQIRPKNLWKGSYLGNRSVYKKFDK